MENKKRVLICDDLWQITRVIQLYISTLYDCECFTEQDSRKMLQRASESKFDLILMDLQLNFTQQKSGKDLARMLRTSGENRETPIIALTACTIIYAAPPSVRRIDYPNTEYWDDLKQIGFTDVIEKPFFYDNLDTILEKYEFTKKEDAALSIPETLFEGIKPSIFVIDTAWSASGITLRGNDAYDIRYFRKADDCIEAYSESYSTVSGVVINAKTDAAWKSTLKQLLDISVVPNIVIAGEADTIQDAVAATKSGATAYIGQPRDERELMAAVSNLMESPLLESDIERREQWIGQRSKSGEELLKRLFSIMAKDSRVWRKNNLLTLYRDMHKDDNIDALNFGDVIECVEKYIGKKIPDLRKGKLLLVEDDAESSRMTVQCYKNYFEITTAADGNETLNLLKKYRDFDLILLDVHLPGKNADELYDEIHSLKGNAQVIVLTAYPELKGVNHFIKRKAYHYLQKPYEPRFLFKQMCLAWLSRIWRQTETTVNFHDLPLLKRLYFLNELLCKKEQRGEALYQNDVYSLFPEVF